MGIRLDSLDVGRGLAALGVVIFHAAQSLPADQMNPSIRQIMFFGQNGIYYFFVLSGFVILHAHRADIGDRQKIPNYLVKRFKRIYPIYWAVLFPVLFVFFLVPSFGHNEFRQLPTIVSAIFLFGDFFPTPLTVAWTLYHEMLFYSVFVALLYSKRVGSAILVLWFLICSVDLFYASGIYFSSSINLLFGMGAIVALQAQRSSVKRPKSMLFAGLSLLIIVGLLQGIWLSETYSALAFGLASALVISSLVDLEKRQTIWFPKPFLYLGAASYAIYLTHGPIISLLSKLTQQGFLNLNSTNLAIMYVIVATMAGCAFHSFVEKPLLSRINARRPKKSKAVQ